MSIGAASHHDAGLRRERKCSFRLITAIRLDFKESFRHLQPSRNTVHYRNGAGHNGTA